MVVGGILVKRSTGAYRADLHSLIGNEWRHGGRQYSMPSPDRSCIV